MLHLKTFLSTDANVSRHSSARKQEPSPGAMVKTTPHAPPVCPDQDQVRPGLIQPWSVLSRAGDRAQNMIGFIPSFRRQLTLELDSCLVALVQTDIGRLQDLLSYAIVSRQKDSVRRPAMLEPWEHGRPGCEGGVSQL